MLNFLPDLTREVAEKSEKKHVQLLTSLIGYLNSDMLILEISENLPLISEKSE